MITLRSRIFIMASVVLLIILAISVFLVVAGKKKAAAPPEGTPTTSAAIDEQNFPAQITTEPTAVPAGTPVKPPTSEEVMKNTAKQMAKIFIERYGTYSTDNNGDNIREVETLVTKALWADISPRIGVKPVGEFMGVTTKVVAVDVVEFSAGAAKVELNTQRTTTKGNLTETTTARADVWLIRSGENWLVTKFEWLK
jgi:hypothetical protein